MKVLVYSHDADVRAQVRLAIGRRPAMDVPEAEIIEVATEPALWRLLDAGRVDVMVLDGEAQPAGAADHRPPRRRLAGHLVTRRRGDQPPDRPGHAGAGAGRADARARRRSRLTCSLSRTIVGSSLRHPWGPPWTPGPPGPACSAR